MRRSITLLAALVCSVSGQSVIKYYYPGGYQGPDPVATIETANPSTTQFKMTCPTDTDPKKCDLSPGVAYNIFSSTRYQAIMTTGTYSFSYGCDYNAQATAMTCTMDQKGGRVDAPSGPHTQVLIGTDVVFNSATIVEGAGLLSASGSTSPTTLPNSVSASASSGSKAKVTTTPPPSVAYVSKTGAKQSAATFTGAAARSGIEGVTLLAMVGAAVVIAL